MRNGFLWRSKRLNVGAERQNLDAREQYCVEDENVAGSSVSMIGIKDDEDEGVETELRPSIFTRKHVIVHHETDTKNGRRKRSSGTDDVRCEKSSRQNKEEAVVAERDDKVLQAELVMGIKKDDEDDRVETELCAKNDVVRIHGYITHEAVAKNDNGDDVVIVHSSSLRKKTEEETREVETRENRDELSLQNLKKNETLSVHETSKAFVNPVMEEEGRSATTPSPPEAEVEQRDEFCADKEEERHPVVPDEEDGSTLRGSFGNKAAGSVSGLKSVETFSNHEESIQANNSYMMDVTTAGGTFWEEDGTTPIDFVKAIISGEVWSDIFDDGKNSSVYPRSASRVSDPDDAGNQVLESISDFIQGGESKQVYCESQAQLHPARMSRREQAKSMNAALAREIQAVSMPHTVPPPKVTTFRDSNQSKQSTTKKLGVVASMKNGHSSRNLVSPGTIRSKESQERTRSVIDIEPTTHTSDRQDTPDDGSKVVYDSTKLPWIEKETTALSPTTSFQLNTREESPGGKKNNEEKVHHDDDDVTKCCGLVEECWAEISRALLFSIHGCNYEDASQSEAQEEPSEPRMTPIKRFPSPTRTQSRGGDTSEAVEVKAGGNAVAPGRRATGSPTIPRTRSPTRRGGQKRSRSLPAAARPSSPLSSNRSKATRRGRSLSRSPAQRRRGVQRSKTKSPRTGTGRQASTKVMTGTRSKRDVATKSPQTLPSKLPGRGKAMSTATAGSASASNSSSKRRFAVRSRETKRKSHYQRSNKNVRSRSSK